MSREQVCLRLNSILKVKEMSGNILNGYTMAYYLRRNLMFLICFGVRILKK